MNQLQTVDYYAEIVWNYHLLHHPLKKSEAILALGSNDIRVAEYAAELFLQGYAPILIFSGGVGELTKGMFNCSEAEYFAKIAIKMGVPAEKIIIEPNSTNTGENIRFTQDILEKRGITVDNFILIQKPFMERRSYATFMQQWPGKDIIVSSPRIEYNDYPNKVLSKYDIINVMVGDLQRIIEYPKLGFQIPQEVPIEVVEAMNRLIKLGYDRHLIG